MHVMRASTLVACAAFLASNASAAALEKRQPANPRTVQFDFQRHHVKDPVTHDRHRLRRRKGTVDVTLDNMVKAFARFNCSSR